MNVGVLDIDKFKGNSKHPSAQEKPHPWLDSQKENMQRANIFLFE